MRLLFTALPVASHVRDLVPLARAASAAGHEIMVCAPGVVADTVREHGLPYHQAGYDWITEPMAEMGARPEVTPAEIDAFMMAIIMELFPGQPAARMADDLGELVVRWRPDLVVRDACEFGGYLLAERLGIPHASVGTVSGCADFLDDRFDAALRVTAGMPLSGVYRHLHLNLTPDRFDPGELCIPTARSVRPDVADVPGERLPPWVADFNPDKPVVLACFGNMSKEFRAWEPVARTIMLGVAELDANVVVAASGIDGAAPAGVRLVDYIPQPLFLECTDLFVTHGGFTSIREALRLGVPLVGVGWTGETRHVLNRCESLGIGRRLDWRGLAPRAVAQACVAVLNDDGFRRRSEQLKREILTMPALAQAVLDLEDLVRS